VSRAAYSRQTYRKDSGTRTAQARRYRDRGSAYLYGSEAPELAYRERERRAVRQPQRTRTAEREENSLFSVILVVFMLAVLTASVIGYVQLMSNVSATSNSISSLETQIKNLKTSNDQKYAEITSSISLDKIKEIAINELHMKYADESQIVTYSNDTGDYVKQLQEVGK
jgi:cell division protein FtsL